jgi:hypothetical protein
VGLERSHRAAVTDQGSVRNVLIDGCFLGGPIYPNAGGDREVGSKAWRPEIVGHLAGCLGGRDALGVAAGIVDRAAQREIGGSQARSSKGCSGVVTSSRTSEGSMTAPLPI